MAQELNCDSHYCVCGYPWWRIFFCPETVLLRDKHQSNVLKEKKS